MYSKQFETFLKQREGFKTHAYIDSGGKPTIGFGTIRYEDGTPVRLGDRISEAEADRLFRISADKKARQVAVLTRGIELKQHQFDMLLSLTYNIGIAGLKKSTLLRLVRENPNDQTDTHISRLTTVRKIIVDLEAHDRGHGKRIALAFMMWSYDNGKFVRGLLSRRIMEAGIYFNGYPETEPKP